MATQRIIRNLALVGFMGSGKSTVGRLVAQDLDFQFVDTDSLIEEKAGIPLPRFLQTRERKLFGN